MLNFILIIILLSLLIRLLLPYLLPKLLKYWFTKQQRKNENWQQDDTPPEGSVNIKYRPPDQKRRKSADDKGEYVDFEEIENNN